MYFHFFEENESAEAETVCITNGVDHHPELISLFVEILFDYKRIYSGGNAEVREILECCALECHLLSLGRMQMFPTMCPGSFWAFSASVKAMPRGNTAPMLSPGA